MVTRHLTVMFTDIKGFTDRSSHQTRSELLNLLEKHEQTIRPIFGQFGGQVIKTIGDAFLVTFDSPTDAVLCGMEIQKVLKTYNQDRPPQEKMEVRVAINSGEVTLKDNDVFGEPVNIAARIEGIAEANEIYFTEAVYLAMNKQEVPSAEVGYRHLKGIPHEIKVYKVVQEPLSKTKRFLGLSTQELLRQHGRSNKNSWYTNLAVGGGIVVLFLLSRNPTILVILLYFYLSYSFFILAKKTETPYPWLAWIPIINLLYCATIAEKDWWWYLLCLIPGVNLVVFVLIWMAIAEKRGHPGWLGILLLVPVLNFFLPGYLALVDSLKISRGQ